MTQLPAIPTGRYADAVRFAIERHVESDGSPQLRKGTQVPYLSHLLAVSALVWEAGGDEDQAIAGLLHDTLEDTQTTKAELVERFGPVVADIVQACSDGSPGMARDASTWRARKVAYLHHLSSATLPVKLVSAADKLHNATSIVNDVLWDQETGNPGRTWSRFNASPEDTEWFYQGVVTAMEKDLAHTKLLRQLESIVNRLSELI